MGRHHLWGGVHNSGQNALPGEKRKKLAKISGRNFPHTFCKIANRTRSCVNECKPPLIQGLAEVRPTETPVLDMNMRADRAIKDNELGGEGWAQLLQRSNKGFPEKAKQFLRDKFQMGEESASDKVSL